MRFPPTAFVNGAVRGKYGPRLPRTCRWWQDVAVFTGRRDPDKQMPSTAARPPHPPNVKRKRAYEPAARGDGYRVLVDRLWPRGVSRERAHLDEWARDLAPSPELRKWFNHDPKRFEEFRTRYRHELDAHRDEVDALHRRAGKGPVTLIYAARDTDHNEAAVLEELIRAG
jgi:uncharacterized protein YeaO (DUF488 family)